MEKNYFFKRLGLCQGGRYYFFKAKNEDKLIFFLLYKPKPFCSLWEPKIKKNYFEFSFRRVLCSYMFFGIEILKLYLTGSNVSIFENRKNWQNIFYFFILGIIRSFFKLQQIFIFDIYFDQILIYLIQWYVYQQIKLVVREYVTWRLV